MPIPEGLDVMQSGDAIVIRRSWRTWAVLPLFFFLIFWFGFLGFWYSMAFKARNVHQILFLLLFPLGHVGAGVWVAYGAVSSLFNHTDVAISSSGVRCSIGPIPWPGNRIIPSDFIQGITVRYRQNNGTVNFSVMYVDASNKEHKLLAGTPRQEQAEFIAASIRQILGLEGDSRQSGSIT